MNKILTAGVTALTTLTACAGVVSVMSVAPSTKTMFDFKGKNQQEITRLNTELKNKDNLITEKDSTIENLEKENNSKQMTIDELTKTVETVEIIIPDELKNEYYTFATKDISSDYMLISPGYKSETEGFWILNKRTGVFTKLFNRGHGAFSIENLGNEFYFICSPLWGDILKFDLNTLNMEVAFASSEFRYFITKLNESYILFSSIAVNGFILYDISNQEFTLFDTDYTWRDFVGIINDYFIARGSNGLFLLNFKTKELRLLDTTSSASYGIFKDNLLVFDNKILYYYNFETYELKTLYTTTSYSSELKVLLLKNGNCGVFSRYEFFEIDFNTFSVVNYIKLKSYRSYLYILPNGEFITGPELTLFYLNEETSLYTSLDLNHYDALKSSYEDLSDGKYRFLSSDNKYVYIYDSNDRTFTLYSLVI